MEMIFAYLIGVLAGGVLMYIFMRTRRPKIVGELMIDYSDPDGPYPFMALNTDFSAVEGSLFIALRVQKTNLLSRK